jgi:predicted nucleic acid-binding protein
VSFLLDTNVLSELRRGVQADENVRAWDSSITESERFTSIIVIAELMKGAQLRSRRDVGGGAALDRWIERVVAEFADRILTVDIAVSSVWARLMAQRSRPPIDMLIAATSITHGCQLVTRNVADFEGTGTQLLNPWTFEG